MFADVRVVIVTLLLILSFRASAQDIKENDGSLLDEMLTLSQNSEIYVQEPFVYFQGISFSSDFSITTSIDGLSGFTFLEGRILGTSKDFFVRGKEALISHQDKTVLLRADLIEVSDHSNTPVENESLRPIADILNSRHKSWADPLEKAPIQHSTMGSATWTCQNGQLYRNGQPTGRDSHSTCQGNNKVTMSCIGNEMTVTIEYGVLRCIATNIGGH